MSKVIIVWHSPDGEEHEETWASVEQFRSWAIGESLHLSYTAYAAPDPSDEDDEGPIISRGQL